MEKRTIAYILIGTAVVIGGGAGVYFVGKEKGWFGDEKPEENPFLTQGGGGGSLPDNTGGGGGNGGGNSGGNSGGGNSGSDGGGNSGAGTVWDEVYLPNKGKKISEITPKAKKLLQYTINQVYAGSSKISVDGLVGPQTRVSFYYAMKAMYPSVYKSNPFDLEKKGEIKLIMKKYTFDAFIDTACRYLAGNKQSLKNISESEIQNMVNNVPKSDIGLSGIFGLAMFGMD